jgi:hypothetical protein
LYSKSWYARTYYLYVVVLQADSLAVASRLKSKLISMTFLYVANMFRMTLLVKAIPIIFTRVDPIHCAPSHPHHDSHELTQ